MLTPPPRGGFMFPTHPNHKAYDFFVIIFLHNPIPVSVAGVPVCDDHQDLGGVRRGPRSLVLKEFVPETDAQ